MELLIVVVVIAVLASIAVVAFGSVSKRAFNAKQASEVDAWIKNFQAYYASNGSYPPTLATRPPGSEYCLGVNFPVPGYSNLPPRCENFSYNVVGYYENADGDPAHDQLMAELAQVMGTPTTAPAVVTTSSTKFVGPYVVWWPGDKAIFYNAFKGGASDCPTGFLYDYDDGAGLVTCTKQLTLVGQ